MSVQNIEKFHNCTTRNDKVTVYDMSSYTMYWYGLQATVCHQCMIHVQICPNWNTIQYDTTVWVLYHTAGGDNFGHFDGFVAKFYFKNNKIGRGVIRMLVSRIVLIIPVWKQQAENVLLRVSQMGGGGPTFDKNGAKIWPSENIFCLQFITALCNLIITPSSHYVLLFAVYCTVHCVQQSTV